MKVISAEDAITLQEARRILTEPPDERVARLAIAAAVICSRKNSKRVSAAELLECLKRGSHSKKFQVVALYAAKALYRKTKREWRPCTLPITDVEDWVRYLKQHGFI